MRWMARASVALVVGMAGGAAAGCDGARDEVPDKQVGAIEEGAASDEGASDEGAATGTEAAPDEGAATDDGAATDGLDGALDGTDSNSDGSYPGEDCHYGDLLNDQAHGWNFDAACPSPNAGTQSPLGWQAASLSFAKSQTSYQAASSYSIELRNTSESELRLTDIGVAGLSLDIDDAPTLAPAEAVTVYCNGAFTSLMASRGSGTTQWACMSGTVAWRDAASAVINELAVSVDASQFTMFDAEPDTGGPTHCWVARGFPIDFGDTQE